MLVDNINHQKPVPSPSQDTYTPIHNDVLEALMQINLSPYETRVLLAIWRKTYGFRDPNSGRRKKSDRIPLYQLGQMTGLDRRHVGRAIQALRKKAIISRDDSGNTAFCKEFMRQPQVFIQPVAPFTEAIQEKKQSDRIGEMKSMAEILSSKPPF